MRPIAVVPCLRICRRWCGRVAYVNAFRDLAAESLGGAMSVSAQAIPPAPPTDRAWGWTAENTPGTNYVTLYRTEDGVDVSVLAPLSFSDPSLHGGLCAEVYTVTVVVTTDKGSLRFECLATEGSLRVRTCSVFRGDPAETVPLASDLGTPADLHRDTVYHVPDWEDQSDAVLVGFQNYLEALGVNDALLDYVAELLQHKETMEYPAWWARVSSFVAPAGDTPPAHP
eukprot:TRINITY_DN12183_c0_g1_i1.p2 TRINITY_DN12183_c0_g1~~TRINITY_DN12183_c0_g1_i1.p2  ORF type:complete len:227 (+),score=63.61 TRINITY_DN12183_c0_g1_i1:70-750(+)